MAQQEKITIGVATIIAAIIAAAAALIVPTINKGAAHPSPSNSIQSARNALQGNNDSLDDQSDNRGNQVGPIHGNGNQITQNINQGRASSHPVTSDMGLKWNMDDFAQTVRNGNLPAIKEYLSAKDGFDPNALWNGNVFVLELPIFEGTKDFPEVLTLFKQTGKLNWNEVNNRSIWEGVYGHAITLQYSALERAANQNNPVDLKALINAGANPSQLIEDEAKAFRQISREGILKGALTGKPTDMRGAELEQDLATFRAVGFPLPNLQEGPTAQEKADSLRQIETCMQDIKAHHNLKELMTIASSPQILSEHSTWQPFESAASYLNQQLLSGTWRGNNVEYDSAVRHACNRPSSTQ